jgi:hypothetical protein
MYTYIHTYIQQIHTYVMYSYIHKYIHTTNIHSSHHHDRWLLSQAFQIWHMASASKSTKTQICLLVKSLVSWRGLILRQRHVYDNVRAVYTCTKNSALKRTYFDVWKVDAKRRRDTKAKVVSRMRGSLLRMVFTCWSTHVTVKYAQERKAKRCY